MRLLISLLVTFGLGAVALAAQPPSAAVPGSFAELADFRTTAALKPWRTHQASGYDRGGGFYDSGNFLREEPGRRYVMLETRGPGCIDRMWFTRKSTEEPFDLLFYLDNRKTPAFRIGVDELCSGTRAPFVAPFAGSVNLARYCYVPIGFRSYCKVVLVPTAAPDRYTYRVNSADDKILHFYYQLTYRALPKGSPVRPFRTDLEPNEARAQEAAANYWQRSGSSVWPLDPALPATVEQQQELQVLPLQQAELFRLAGSGTIQELHLRLAGNTPANALRLLIYWDGASEPAVNTPLGTFFAAPDRRTEVRGLWLGSKNGEYYCYLPMPYRKGARLVVQSNTDQPATLSARVCLNTQNPGRDQAYLYAQSYDHQPPLPPAHYEVVSATGRGQFIGLVMDRPGNMEGDDQFYVDGEQQPSINGTGTEDFFSFAWGFSHLAALPLHGITRHGGSAIPYRFHLPAGVPFRKSLRLVFEHGHGNEHQGRYSGTAFYYFLPNPERPSHH